MSRPVSIWVTVQFRRSAGRLEQRRASTNESTAVQRKCDSSHPPSDIAKDDVTSASNQSAAFQGNDKLLFGIIFGVLTFWLFAQTTLNIAPDMGKDLGLDANAMNTAVSI